MSNVGELSPGVHKSLSQIVFLLACVTTCLLHKKAKSPGDEPASDHHPSTTTLQFCQHHNTMAETDRRAKFNLNGVMMSTQEIEFKHILKDGDWSASYLVNIRRQPYVMKVHFVYPEHQEGGERMPMHNEIQAYERLQGHGLSESDVGYIPRFYGVIEDFDRNLLPSPSPVGLEDSRGAGAILLEYIPGLHILETQTYTRDRGRRLLEILQMIHEAGVLHNDIGQHNLGVSAEGERVLWLDFDMATTFDEKTIQTAWQQEQLKKHEMEIAASIVKELVAPPYLKLRSLLMRDRRVKTQTVAAAGTVLLSYSTRSRHCFDRRLTMTM